MVKEVVKRGGESVIYKIGEEIVKERVRKRYRHEILDVVLRKKRTKQEATILKKLHSAINVPKVKEVKEYSIKMEYIEGVTLKEWLENWNEKKGIEEVINKVAEILSEIHKQNISHQDFTPKNIILKNAEARDGLEVYVIDFGLATYTTRAEDKAVDLYLFEEVIRALKMEGRVKKKVIELFLHYYFSFLPSSHQRDQIKRRLETIRKRRRYMQKGDAP